MGLDQQRRERRAPPGIAAGGERAQRIAVIALAAGDDVAPPGLAALGEVLPRHLERRLDRLRAAADEIDVAQPRRSILDQPVGQLLGHLGGEEAGVRIGELVELLVQGGRHRGMAVAEARHRRTARGVDVALARLVDELDALAADGDGQGAGDLAMQDVGHDLSFGPRRGKWTPKAASCASVRVSASSAFWPERPATRAARISATASSGVMVWKKDGLSVATGMIDTAICARGETSEVGERHHRHALLGGVARAFDGGAGVGLDAGGQHDVALAGIADGVEADAAGIVQHHRLVAQERQHVVEVPGDAVAGAQAEAIDAPCLVQAARGVGQAVERRRLGQPRDLAAEGQRHVGRQCPLAAQLLDLHLHARLAGEAQGAVAYRAGIKRAHLVIAFESEPLGQPGHGRGRHAGAPRLLAHGKQRHVVRAVEHVARRGLQLRRERVERLDDRAGERPALHYRTLPASAAAARTSARPCSTAH